MRTLVVVSLIAGFASCHESASAEGTDNCPVTDEQFFEQLRTMTTWPQIHAVYKRNIPFCPDDGVCGEAYTDVVVVALARRWSELAELQRLVKRDPGFRRFVYRHIDATADGTDLRDVLNNARTKCPRAWVRFCDEIAARAEAAIGMLK